MKNCIYILFAFVFCLSTFSSCEKEEDTLVEIKVVTIEGTPVAGAEVRLFGQGTTNQVETSELRIDRTQITAANGITTFDFSDLYVPGQSGFAILNVEIVKVFPDGPLEEEGIIQIVEEETNRKTFILE